MDTLIAFAVYASKGFFEPVHADEVESAPVGFHTATVPPVVVCGNSHGFKAEVV